MLAHTQAVPLLRAVAFPRSCECLETARDQIPADAVSRRAPTRNKRVREIGREIPAQNFAVRVTRKFRLGARRAPHSFRRRFASEDFDCARQERRASADRSLLVRAKPNPCADVKRDRCRDRLRCWVWSLQRTWPTKEAQGSQ